MTNTLKLSILAALALTTVVAEARDGVLHKVDVTTGHASGLRDLRFADGKYFRIESRGFSAVESDWTCSFLAFHGPTNLSRVEVRVTGTNVGGGRIKMLLFDYIALKWTEVASVGLPVIGMSEYSFRVRKGHGPERFVSANGQAKVRFKSASRSVVLDQVIFRAVGIRDR